MVEADDARQLPRAVSESPEVNESTLAERLSVIVAGMVKAMDADLQGAPALDRIHLEAPRNQLAGHLAADVLLHRIDEVLLPDAEAVAVVIELDVLGEV